MRNIVIVAVKTKILRLALVQHLSRQAKQIQEELNGEKMRVFELYFGNSNHWAMESDI